MKVLFVKGILGSRFRLHLTVRFFWYLPISKHQLSFVTLCLQIKVSFEWCLFVCLFFSFSGRAGCEGRGGMEWRVNLQKFEAVWQLVRQLIHNAFYSRYQAPLFLWQIKPILKSWKVLILCPWLSKNFDFEDFHFQNRLHLITK